MALVGLAAGVLLIGARAWLPDAQAQSGEVRCMKFSSDLADHVEYGVQPHIQRSIRPGGGAFAVPLAEDRVLACAW